jgi:hypothetical protein
VLLGVLFDKLARAGLYAPATIAGRSFIVPNSQTIAV